MNKPPRISQRLEKKGDEAVQPQPTFLILAQKYPIKEVSDYGKKEAILKRL